jgi:hypothetical protein
MSLWGSDIFGASRERNQNEEWVRRQSISQQEPEENLFKPSEKDEKTIHLWTGIGIVIILLIIVGLIILY